MRDWRRHGGLDLMLALGAEGELPPEGLGLVRSLFEMRASIGADAARLAALRADAAARAELEARAAALAAADDPAARTAIYDVLWDQSSTRPTTSPTGSRSTRWSPASTSCPSTPRRSAPRSSTARRSRAGRAIADGDADHAHAAASELLGARSRRTHDRDPVLRVPLLHPVAVVEFLSFRHLEADGLVGYDLQDSRTSITMGIGNVIINVGWKFAVLALYAVLYELAPWHLPTDAWWVWVALFFADDFSYYWFHRVSHESRVFWASHVVHHSSQHYNLSTALRQTWVPMTYAPFWLWMPLVGFAPWMVLLAQAWSLIYQFGIHTERIGRLSRPIEAVFNTPSHHRVHHGSNEQYLDKNYGGILVIWDRLFGTWEPEGERVRYGLTTNIETHNVVRVASTSTRAVG